MGNIKFLLEKIKEKNNQPIIWSNNRFYKGRELLKNIEIFRIKLRKSKVKNNSLIAFESDFNFESISFFIACLMEKMIIIPLPSKQKELLKLVPCEYFANIKTFKIIKLKKEYKNTNKILKTFQKNNTPGLIVFSSGSSGKQKAILHNFSLLLNKFLHTFFSHFC